MSTQLPDLPRLLEFQRLLQAFNRVDRSIHRSHHGAYRHENDTEHSYNLAMTAWFLAPYFPQLDPSRLIQYSLAHDLVEIHAGDTDIYADSDVLASKHDREVAAAAKLMHDWPDFPELHERINEYEAKATEESRFIYALDKIMPILLIYIHDGYTWTKHGITLARLHAAKKDKVALSPEIQHYYDQLYELLLNSPHIIKPA